jgi:hypothetical protein
MAFKSKTIAAGINPKTVKGDKGGKWLTAIMYLAPFTLSGFNVCAMASTAACVEGCLNLSGNGGMFKSVQIGRIAKTQRYWADRAAFMAELVRDIAAFVRHCARKGVKPAVRLNGTSDIQWETAHPCIHKGERFTSIFAAFPDVQFYDYTKIYKRLYRELPANYRLVLSYSGADERYADAILKTAHETGANIAVVYRTKALRDEKIRIAANLSDAQWELDPLAMVKSREVIDGDSDDMRWLDPQGVIVGLYAKGPAKKDQSGFVVG